MDITPHYADDAVKLFHGDCLDILRDLPDASVDSIVTDPPYGLGFMGREWDNLPPGVEWATECLRVLKPGGHMVAFGGSRTWHRLAAAVEDAGFEIRDSIAWLYGSGFPKSMDVSKAIDKRRDWALVERLAGEIRRAREASGLSLKEIGAATLAATDGTYGKWYHRGGHMFFETGRNLPSRPEWDQLRHILPISREFLDVYDEAEREVIQERTMTQGGGTSLQIRIGEVREVQANITAPATDAARQWQGWGTALKPAFEPIVVGRKPLAGTVAANVLEHGTGAINVDGCRIATDDDLNGGAYSGTERHDRSESWRYRPGGAGDFVAPPGRWPTNVALDESQASELDRQSGVLHSGTMRAGTERQPRAGGTIYGADSRNFAAADTYGDSGGASRFFPTFHYEAKAPGSERPAVDGIAHPTVKPLDLMRWLVRLVTPPGGTVLEPFAGSGTTAEACVVEGFKCIAIEREADYLPLIVQRLSKPIQVGLDFGEAS